MTMVVFTSIFTVMAGKSDLLLNEETIKKKKTYPVVIQWKITICILCKPLKLTHQMSEMEK